MATNSRRRPMRKAGSSYNSTPTKSTYDYDPAKIYDPAKNKSTPINQKMMNNAKTNTDYSSLSNFNKGNAVNNEKSYDFDYGKLMDFMKTQNLNTTTPYAETKPTTYNPMFTSDNIKNTFNNIQSKSYNYDPTQDTLLQLSQNQAMNQTGQNMAKRGMLFSDSAKNKMFQSAMNLTPQFEKRAFDRYQGETKDLYNQLNTMQGLENSNFNRYRTNEQDRINTENVNRDRYFQDADFQKGLYDANIKDQEAISQREIDTYGVALSPRMKEYESTYQQMNQNDLKRLLPLGQQEGGFATTINQLMKTDPNNPDLPLLETLRAMKILSNPQMLNQYGSEYGMEAMGINKVAQEQQQYELLNKLELLQEEAKTKQEQNKIKEIAEKIKEIQSNTKYKDAQAIKVAWDILYRKIETENLDEKLKAELKTEIGKAAASYASAANSYSQINDRDRKFNAGYEDDGQGGYQKKPDPENQAYKIAINNADEILRTDGPLEAIEWLENNRGSIVGALGSRDKYIDVFNTALAPAMKTDEVTPYDYYYNFKDKDFEEQFSKMFLDGFSKR